MLKEFSGLTQQLFEKPFKRMPYGIYNIADEERYIVKYSSYGYDVNIENFEYMTFDTEDIDNEEVFSFKKYIEEEIENYRTVIGILPIRRKQGGCYMFAIKPKDVKVEQIIKVN